MNTLDLKNEVVNQLLSTIDNMQMTAFINETFANELKFELEKMRPIRRHETNDIKALNTWAVVPLWSGAGYFDAKLYHCSIMEYNKSIERTRQIILKIKAIEKGELQRNQLNLFEKT